jgi:hypothetical protein
MFGPLSTRDLSQPLYDARGWVKLLGILNIISGVLACLTLVGILWGWLPLWQGILLFNAGKQTEQAWTGEDPERLREALRQLKTYFILSGVSMLATLALTVLAFIAILGLGAVGLLSGLEAVQSM